jgi:hypothetical protein
MTLTPSIDAADKSPADDVQSLIWALVSHQVVRIQRGVFDVRGEELRNGRPHFVQFRVTVQEE